MNRKTPRAALMIILAVSMSLTAAAHPGKTDANGGHYNRKTGEYHYHNGGGSSSSSRSSYTAPTAPKHTGPTYATKVNAVNVPKIALFIALQSICPQMLSLFANNFEKR